MSKGMMVLVGVLLWGSGWLVGATMALERMRPKTPHVIVDGAYLRIEPFCDGERMEFTTHALPVDGGFEWTHPSQKYGVRVTRYR
jgi:hypothetical protein